MEEMKSERKVSGDKERDKAKEKMREERTRGEKRKMRKTECQEKEEGERVWLRRKGWTEGWEGGREGGREKENHGREGEKEAVLIAKGRGTR